MRDYGETIIEQSGEAAAVEFTALPEWDYFDGHFPGFRLLPGVAQVDVAVRFAHRFFNCGLGIKAAKRLKFTAIIQPGAKVRLDLKFNKTAHSVSYAFTDPETGAPYSQGAYTPEGLAPAI